MIERKTLLAASVAAFVGAMGHGVVSAADGPEPCENCADEMTIVSWGGAYSNSQLKAYHEPYTEATGVEIINDESLGRGGRQASRDGRGGQRHVGRRRRSSRPTRCVLCDEGLAMEIDFDEQLASAPDGTSATEDFGEFLVSDCFIPQIVYSTTFGYRTDVAEWNGEVPGRRLRRVRHRGLPRQAFLAETSPSTTWSGH